MIATAVLAADYAGTLDLLDTTSVRARTTHQISGPANTRLPPQPAQFGIDLVTTPAVHVRMADRHWEYTLSYSPTLTLPDVGLGSDPQLLHFASASVAWRYHATSLTLTEGATYGQVNSKFLYQAPPVPGQPIVLQPAAAPVTIQFGSSVTDLTAGFRASQRVQLSLSGGYALRGGLDADARTQVPEQYGPLAAASFNYVLSGRDTLATTANALDVSTFGGCPPPGDPLMTCRARTSTFELQETWRRLLSPVVLTSAGAGVAAAHTQTDAGHTKFYPVALASVAYRFGPRGTSNLTLSAQLAPLVDIRTGLASERFQVNGVLTDILTPTIALHAGVGILQTVPTSDPYSVTTLNASLDATFRLDRLFSLTVGQQGLWQDQASYGTLVSAFSYVALTVRAPALRL